MRISDWSSDVCSSDLQRADAGRQRALDHRHDVAVALQVVEMAVGVDQRPRRDHQLGGSHGAIHQLLTSPSGLTRGSRATARTPVPRSEEHTSELQSLMRSSYAVFCLKKKTTNNNNTNA